MREAKDHTLPPDRRAFIASEPQTGRVIVVAPTRAACETIELAMQLRIATVLEREHGDEIRGLARSGEGFGIVAGTGTGKTLAVRTVAEEILRTPLRVGVVNREREATPETPTWNVIIVTTGIARRWFQDGDILSRDTLVIDEIHQTSAELELCLALGKRVGCRFIWLSATVDPSFYREYLNSTAVLESSAFDPTRAATVKVVRSEPLDFLNERFLKGVYQGKRGVGVFLPTRAQVEEVAEHVAATYPRIAATHYHGGEPIRVIRPYLEEGVRRPFVLSMTAAGQSALNVKGLDTVVIEDVRFANVIQGGRNVLTKLHLGANELLQMAGRVHGRVPDGKVFILSDRNIDFGSLRPTPPEFQLAGDSERVAMTCADLGVRADELQLPVPLDKQAYRAAVVLLERRGIIVDGRLSRYGRNVEAMPVDRPWAELLVNADDELLPYLAVAASIESLHRMTRQERELRGVAVRGSDHMTAYNLYAEAYAECGYVGEVYGLPRHLFREEELESWAARRGALVKAIEDAALASASIFRSLGVPLPEQMPAATDRIRRAFVELLAEYMPFELVIDQQTASGGTVQTSRDSMCSNWGAVAGDIRYFAARDGSPRASIEGTELPMELIRRFAVHRGPEAVIGEADSGALIRLEWRSDFHGFTVGRKAEEVAEFPPEYAAEIRRALSNALARGDNIHPQARKAWKGVEQVREIYRRSGGRTEPLTFDMLVKHFLKMSESWHSTAEFLGAPLKLSVAEFVADERIIRECMALPAEVRIRGVRVPLHYELEEGDITAPGGGELLGKRPVVRLHLPAKIAGNLTVSELPSLDREMRFLVTRGKRGTVRGDSLQELQERLDEPWGEDEREWKGTHRRARGVRGRPDASAGRGRRRGGDSGGGEGTGAGAAGDGLLRGRKHRSRATGGDSRRSGYMKGKRGRRGRPRS